MICGGEYSIEPSYPKTQMGNCPHCGRQIYIMSGLAAPDMSAPTIQKINAAPGNMYQSKYAHSSQLKRNYTTTKKQSTLGEILVVLAWVNVVCVLIVLAFFSIGAGSIGMIGAGIFLAIAYGIKNALEK